MPAARLQAARCAYRFNFDDLFGGGGKRYSLQADRCNQFA